jgi:beta-galactosidase
VCTYRYRQPRFGSEMYHEGIVGLDGATLSQGGREFTQVMGELARVKPELTPGAPLPAALAARSTAFLWSHDVMWDLDIQKQSESWSTWRHRNRVTAAVKSTGAPMSFIAEGDDFSKYPFLVAPAYQLADAALLARWRRYAEAGGHLVLTCRSAQKGADSQFPEVPFGSRLQELIGARVEGFDTLPGEVTQEVRAGAATFKWRTWGDLLRPEPGTTTLATYEDGFYKGEAAAVTHRLGKGSVTYLGVDTLDGALETRLLRGVYEAAGVPVEDLPKGVYVEWRDGVRVGVNYSGEAVTLPLPAGSRILVGSNPLQPAQVLVWKEAALPVRK